MAEFSVVVVNIFHGVWQRFRHVGGNQHLGLGIGEGRKVRENGRRKCVWLGVVLKSTSELGRMQECVGGHRPNNHFSISGHVSFQHLHLPGIPVFLCSLDPILFFYFFIFESKKKKKKNNNNK